MKAWCTLTLVLLSAAGSSADECATRLQDLSKTERLATLKPLLKNGNPIGFVNETKGSYFILEERDGKFQITFYTSGLFDLYGIKREGDLSFCDNGHELRVIGLDRNDELTLAGDGKLQLGAGGPKRHFEPGAMPEPLMRLHHVGERGIASDH